VKYYLTMKRKDISFQGIIFIFIFCGFRGKHDRRFLMSRRLLLLFVEARGARAK
jgi:hypothetical protein